MKHLEQQRLASAISRRGICSRREAERMIAEGRVTVNGLRPPSTGQFVDDSDCIALDGKVLPEKHKTRLWLYHKPPGIIVSHKDTHGRPTVFQDVFSRLGRVLSVGRLDLMSEGLLLLTNQPFVQHQLEKPTSKTVRRYQVMVKGPVKEGLFSSLKQGISIEGMHYGPIKAHVYQKDNDCFWVSMDLTEGKNREIRRIMAHMGLSVIKLKRTHYGPYGLNDLKPCDVKEVPLLNF